MIVTLIVVSMRRLIHVNNDSQSRESREWSYGTRISTFTLPLTYPAHRFPSFHFIESEAHYLTSEEKKKKESTGESPASESSPTFVSESSQRKALARESHPTLNPYLETHQWPVYIKRRSYVLNTGFRSSYQYI